MSTLTDETPIIVTEEQVDEGDGDWEDDLIHICCDQCRPRMALCGGELDDEALDSFGDDELCIVCFSLAQAQPPCSTCGRPIQ